MLVGRVPSPPPRLTKEYALPPHNPVYTTFEPSGPEETMRDYSVKEMRERYPFCLRCKTKIPCVEGDDTLRITDGYCPSYQLYLPEGVRHKRCFVSWQLNLPWTEIFTLDPNTQKLVFTSSIYVEQYCSCVMSTLTKLGVLSFFSDNEKSLVLFIRKETCEPSLRTYFSRFHLDLTFGEVEDLIEKKKVQ